MLVVWKLDRLGRNLAHLVNTVQDLLARGVGLRVLAGQGAQIDTTTAGGRLVFGIFAALAEVGPVAPQVLRQSVGPCRAPGLPGLGAGTMPRKRRARRRCTAGFRSRPRRATSPPPRAFTHLRTGEPCRDRIGPLNVLLAARWHVEGDAFDRALAVVVEAQAALPMVAFWGTGRTASSDGQFFPAAGRGRGPQPGQRPVRGRPFPSAAVLPAVKGDTAG